MKGVSCSGFPDLLRTHLPAFILLGSGSVLSHAWPPRQCSGWTVGKEPRSWWWPSDYNTKKNKNKRHVYSHKYSNHCSCIYQIWLKTYRKEYLAVQRSILVTVSMGGVAARTDPSQSILPPTAASLSRVESFLRSS